MTWLPFDDGFPEEPVADRIGPYGGWLHTCALCYCSRALTDGFVPRGMVSRLAAVPSPLKLAALLVEVGLWNSAPDGFQIVDYLVGRQSKADVESRREATRTRVQTWRERQRNTVTGRVSNGAGNSTAHTHGSSPIPPQAGAACDKQHPQHPSCRSCGTDKRTTNANAKKAGPWCGVCNEKSRMFEPDDGPPSKCPCAQPVRGTA